METKASFHTATCDFWFDVFIVDGSDKLLSFSKFEIPFINGHDLIDIMFQCDAIASDQLTIKRRCLKNFNRHDFINYLDMLLPSSEIILNDSTAANDIDTFLA